jgi:hypothetical protein
MGGHKLENSTNQDSFTEDGALQRQGKSHHPFVSRIKNAAVKSETGKL